MFTTEHLAALGALTIRFAELDEAITELLTDLLRCDEYDIAWSLVVRMDFSRKVEKARELVRFYSDKFGIAADSPVEATIAVLKEMEEVARRRNEIVHSHIHFSLDETKHVFKHHKKGTVDASQSVVTNLLNDADRVTVRCMECWIGLRRLLDGKYAEASES